MREFCSRPVAALLIVAVMSVLTPALPACAQGTIGAKAGLISADLDGSGARNTDRLRGFAGGVFITYALVQELSAQVELLYIQKGAELHAGSPGAITRATLRLDYIELPVMFRLEARVLGPLSLYGVAGPSMAVRVRCDLDGRGCTQDTGQADIRTFDWSMVGGGGFNLATGNLTAFVEGRYHIGLATIDKSSADLDRTHQARGILAGASMRLR